MENLDSTLVPFITRTIQIDNLKESKSSDDSDSKQGQEKKKFILDLTPLPTFTLSSPEQNNFIALNDSKSESIQASPEKRKHKKPVIVSSKNAKQKIEKLKNNKLFSQDEISISPKSNAANSQSEEFSMSPKFSIASSRSCESIKSSDSIMIASSRERSNSMLSLDTGTSMKSPSSSMSLDSMRSKRSNSSPNSFESATSPKLLPENVYVNRATERGDIKRKMYKSRHNSFNPDTSEKNKTNKFLNIVEDKELKIAKLRMVSDNYWANQLDKNLVFNKFETICTKQTVIQSVQSLFDKIIKEEAFETLFLYKNKYQAEKLRALKIITIMQNDLISVTSVYARLKERIEHLTNLLLKKELITPMTHFLYKTLKELKSLATSIKNYNFFLLKEEKKQLQGNLSKFLDCIKRIKKGTYLPKDEQEDKYNKKIAPIILNCFGDDKKTQKEVLSFFKGWLGTTNKVQQYSDTIHLCTFNEICENISCVEHLWEEPLNHNREPGPIDKISPKDVYENYGRLKIPVKINNDDPIDGKNCSAAKFIMKLMIGLYKAFNFELNEKKLKAEITNFSRITTWEEGNFSKESLQCFRLLKMACINTGFRADFFLRCRLEGIFDKGFFMPNENVSLYFHIANKNDSLIEQEKERTYIKQKRQFHIDSREIGSPRYATIPITWKIFEPVEDSWECVLKLKKIEILNNQEIDLELNKHLQIHIINLTSDKNVEIKLNKSQIKDSTSNSNADIEVDKHSKSNINNVISSSDQKNKLDEKIKISHYFSKKRITNS